MQIVYKFNFKGQWRTHKALTANDPVEVGPGLWCARVFDGKDNYHVPPVRIKQKKNVMLDAGLKIMIDA